MSCADPARQHLGRWPRPGALLALAVAAALLAPAIASAQATFPGQEPGRVGGVSPADGQGGVSPAAKAAAAAQNKQIAQELIDKQRDEAARLKALEDRRELRERLERDAGLLGQPLGLLKSMFQLPAELPLSADHRAAAESVLGVHRERITAAWSSWVTGESAQGKDKLDAETVSREALRAPGWTYAAQPRALRCELLRCWSQEQVRELDDISLARALAAPAAAPDPAQLRNGTATRHLAFEWTLQ